MPTLRPVTSRWKPETRERVGPAGLLLLAALLLGLLAMHGLAPVSATGAPHQMHLGMSDATTMSSAVAHPVVSAQETPGPGHSAPGHQWHALGSSCLAVLTAVVVMALGLVALASALKPRAPAPTNRHRPLRSGLGPPGSASTPSLHQLSVLRV